MKQALRWKYLILPLAFALAAGAQNPGEPVPGIGGEGFSAVNFVKLLQESGATFQEPVRVTGSDFMFFDPLDPELGEFFSQMGIAILAMQMGGWPNIQSTLVAVNLEQNRLVSTFGDNGIAPVNFSEGANFVEDVFVQPDGRIVAAGYTTSGSNTQMALARLLPNGQPDPSFGTGGTSVYSAFTGDQPGTTQYSVCNKVTPVYDENGQIQHYVASGESSGEPPAGRALVFFDPNGNVMQPLVVDRTGEQPVSIPTKNGAIVQEPWGDYTGVAQMAGGFLGLSSSHEGPTLERFSFSNGAIGIMNRQPFNPDPGNFPDNLVYVQGMAFNPQTLSLWATGFFMPDWQNPEYDTEVPFLSRNQVGQCGALLDRQLISLPASISLHEQVMFSDVIHAPMAMPSLNKHGILDKAWQRPPAVNDAPSHRASEESVERFYVIGGGDRAEEEDHDVLVMRYLPDGSVDEEFGEGGLAVLNFGPNEWWVTSSVTATGDFLVCVSTGDSTYLTVLRGWADTAVRSVPVRPGEFALHPVYPNPFNPQTTITFHLPAEERVRISILDVKGREVETLLSGPAAAGEHRLVWDGSGRSSGTYFVRIETPSIVRTRKAVLLR